MMTLKYFEMTGTNRTKLNFFGNEFFLCWKHSNLKAEIGKQRKTKLNCFGSSFDRQTKNLA